MPRQTADHTIAVLQASDIISVSGAAETYALGFSSELVLDDIYRLRAKTMTHSLALRYDHLGQLVVAPGTTHGTPGARVHLDATLTFMTPNASLSEVIILVQVDDIGCATQVFALPLTPLQPQSDYQLIGIDTTNVSQRFALIDCASFTRGTHIAMGNGHQKRIEDLSPGDAVLTRDNGIQNIRWIGQSTQRAAGDVAPIRIAAASFHNARDLILSPEHRVFVYQRQDHLGASRPELLVKARHLISDGAIAQEQCGFVDYFQILFDHHQIIYAEGLAVETMVVDARKATVLPAELSKNATAQPPVLHPDQMWRLEVSQHMFAGRNPVDVLYRASLGDEIA